VVGKSIPAIPVDDSRTKYYLYLTSKLAEDILSFTILRLIICGRSGNRMIQYLIECLYRKDEKDFSSVETTASICDYFHATD
jgi:hypothetical protein